MAHPPCVAHVEAGRAPARLRAWLAVAAWAGLIALFSSAWFSGDQTGGFVLPLLRALFPGASPEFLWGLHAFVRKGAHVAEYLVLGVLLVRALREEGLEGGRLAATAAIVGVAYAGLDELHQAFVPTRTGSPSDVLVDAVGVVVGVVMGVTLASARRGARAATPAAPRPAEN